MKDFEEFAKQEGFTHHRITPLHPRANGEAESFMKMLNKTEQIAHLQGKDTSTAVRSMAVRSITVQGINAPRSEN